MGWFTDEIEHSDRYRVLLDVSDHLWRGDDLVLQVGGPVSGFWIGYLAGLATLPAVAVLVFLGARGVRTVAGGVRMGVLLLR